MSESSGRVHIYCRVSSEGQEDGYSLDDQEAACREWAAERGLSVASLAREVYSSGELHRPELDAMIARLLPGDVFLCMRKDRLIRHQRYPHVLEYFIEEEKGARLEFVKKIVEKAENAEETEEDIFVENSENYFNAKHRQRIRDDTQRGRVSRIRSGKPHASPKPPYGYRWADPEKKKGNKSAFLLDDETAPVVRLIFDLALEGVALRAIAAKLQERGILSPTGGVRWSATTIREILVKPVYTGNGLAYLHRYDRVGGRYKRRPARPDEQVALPGIAPAIVTEQEFAAVASRLQRNKVESTRRNKTPELALLRAGFAICAYCGRVMAIENAAPSTPHRNPTYRCLSRRKDGLNCQQPSLSSARVDEAVWAGARYVLTHPEVIGLALAQHRDDGGWERELDAVEKRLQGVVSKQKSVVASIEALDDDDAAAPLRDRLKELAASKKGVEAERDALRRRVADQDAETQRVKSLTEWIEQFGENVDTFTYAERRDALDALGIKVYIWREGAADEDGNPLPRFLPTMAPVDPNVRSILYGQTHHAVSFEPRCGGEGMAIFDGEANDGVAGGGEEMKR